ncbi:MAG TPA: branched-chain amino acid ABC transporter substrate-binding protein [Candidatus Baltobacteraceae bacterium]|nr:branched-chain amino acid ABC transporter substrate-binding protein [Candidatus Baltobacteraceae bacterium]
MLRSHFLAGVTTAAVTNAAPSQTFLQQSTIGVNVPLTGQFAQYGGEIVRGVQAAIDETNRYTSTLTRAWGVRTFDDRNTVAVAQSNVFVAASDPSIVGMVGDLTADITLAALPQYANANFAVVVPSSTADAITARNFHNVFRLPTSDSSEGQLFARATLQKRSATAVVAVTVDGDFGFDTAQAFVAQAKSDKHIADVLTLGAKADPADSAAIILKRSPIFVFLSGRPDRLGPVAIAMRQQGYQGDFGLSDGFYTSATIDTYEKPFDGALVCTSMPPLERVPSIIPLLNDFRNEVGAITAFSAYGYAAAQLLISASQRGNATNRFQLLTELQSGGVYNLLVGQYAFNLSGDATLPNIYIFRVTADGFKYDRAAVPNGFAV